MLGGSPGTGHRRRGSGFARPSCAEGPEGPYPGGYAGVCMGEAQNRGPADHGRDSAQEEPCPRRTRIDEAGDAVPEIQHSITRRGQNLQLAGIPAEQPVQTDRSPCLRWRGHALKLVILGNQHVGRAGQRDGDNQVMTAHEDTSRCMIVVYFCARR